MVGAKNLVLQENRRCVKCLVSAPNMKLRYMGWKYGDGKWLMGFREDSVRKC